MCSARIATLPRTAPLRTALPRTAGLSRVAALPRTALPRTALSRIAGLSGVAGIHRSGSGELGRHRQRTAPQPTGEAGRCGTASRALRQDPLAAARDRRLGGRKRVGHVGRAALVRGAALVRRAPLVRGSGRIRRIPRGRPGSVDRAEPAALRDGTTARFRPSGPHLRSGRLGRRAEIPGKSGSRGESRAETRPLLIPEPAPLLLLEGPVEPLAPLPEHLRARFGGQRRELRAQLERFSRPGLGRPLVRVPPTPRVRVRRREPRRGAVRNAAGYPPVRRVRRPGPGRKRRGGRRRGHPRIRRFLR